MTLRFALIGAAGFVAPRHLEAIKAVGGELVAALDPHDSVGILDRYSKDVHFFTESDRFERHLAKWNNTEKGVDFLVVCSPNYMHADHVRMGLRNGCNVICEKPLALNPENLDAMGPFEKESGCRVSTVLQLRAHPKVEELKQAIARKQMGRHKVEVVYRAPRGRWYHHSWKGDPEKSGGLVTNIGVHLFDLLLYVFGYVQGWKVWSSDQETVAGELTLARADVTWSLSIRPDAPVARELVIDGVPLDLTEGFEDAHTEVYRRIVEGRGYRIEDARAAIELCWNLNKQRCS